MMMIMMTTTTLIISLTGAICDFNNLYLLNAPQTVSIMYVQVARGATICTSTCTHASTHPQSLPLNTHTHTQIGVDAVCRPAYPKMLLSVLRTAYVHIFRFFTRFFVYAPPINQNKSVKGQLFYHSSCKNSVWTHIPNYTDSLHSDDFILFTSAKVVLHWRTQNTFSKSNAPCVLLSLMLTPPFLNGCCLIGVCFLGFEHSFSSSSVSCSHLSPTASNSNPPYWKMANFRKVLNAKSMFIGLTNFLDQSGPAVYLSPKNGLK